MPTVLRHRAFRFFFYSNEASEPAHIHVERGKFTAKFWLQPVELARNGGFAEHELNQLTTLVTLHETLIQEAWNEHFNTSCHGEARNDD